MPWRKHNLQRVSKPTYHSLHLRRPLREPRTHRPNIFHGRRTIFSKILKHFPLSPLPDQAHNTILNLGYREESLKSNLERDTTQPRVSREGSQKAKSYLLNQPCLKPIWRVFFLGPISYPSAHQKETTNSASYWAAIISNQIPEMTVKSLYLHLARRAKFTLRRSLTLRSPYFLDLQTSYHFTQDTFQSHFTLPHKNLFQIFIDFFHTFTSF